MRRVEPYMPEGMGVWFLRYEGTEDEKVADRGPYLARKSALKGARQMNEEADFVGEDYLASEPEIEITVLLAPEVKKAMKDAEDIAFLRGKPKRTPKVKPETAEPAETVKVVATSAARHAWIEDAAQFALEIVAKAGGEVHDRIRVTMGWPVGLRGGKVVGQCWSELASKDGVREVFISPAMDDSSHIVDVLIHELCHACLPHEVKHGPQFKALVTKCGLVGKPTSTEAGEELKEIIDAWVAEHGPYPAGAVDPAASGRKKQSTRLIKAECGECGYTIRTTRKWLAVGHPHCPDVNCDGHDEPMQVDGGEEEEGDDEE